MFKRTVKFSEKQGYEAEVLRQRCWLFLRPLLRELHQRLDRRLVKTCLDLVMVILIHRHRNNGLLLSELGDELLGGERGPAGVKRIAKLLHSSKWESRMIEAYFWQKADERVISWQPSQGDRYAIWDESVIEKPESLKAEGLCAVRSSKAARLKRIKPGYFNPPGGRPIFVPGLHWLQVILVGSKEPPSLAHLRFWTTRGELESDKRSQEHEVLRQVAQSWGREVIHVWDRGFAGSPWITLALQYPIRFILRWKKDYKLIGPDGLERKAWQILRGKRSWEHRLVYDARRRCYRRTGIYATPVRLPDHPALLWMAVSRPGQGQKPWYILTNEPITSAEEAWRIVFAYARRWQVEMSIRFTKSEMAFECPRLHKWESRLKFMGITALAFAFLLSILSFPKSLFPLLSSCCHRTGKWSRETSAPLYRLRLTISRLWRSFRPISLPRLI